MQRKNQLPKNSRNLPGVIRPESSRHYTRPRFPRARMPTGKPVLPKTTRPMDGRALKEIIDYWLSTRRRDKDNPNYMLPEQVSILLYRDLGLSVTGRQLKFYLRNCLGVGRATLPYTVKLTKTTSIVRDRVHYDVGFELPSYTS